MKADLNSLGKAAIEAAAAKLLGGSRQTEIDSVLANLKQLREMARTQVNDCQHAVVAARRAKNSAETTLACIQYRIEMREIEMGLRDEHGLIKREEDVEWEGA